MYSGSCLALLYLLLYTVKLPSTFDHTESHASFFLRLGAIIFGLGSLIFHLLETILYIMIDASQEGCVDYVHTTNSVLSVLFVLLQVPKYGIYFIFFHVLKIANISK